MKIARVMYVTMPMVNLSRWNIIESDLNQKDNYVLHNYEKSKVQNQ